MQKVNEEHLLNSPDISSTFSELKLDKSITFKLLHLQGHLRHIYNIICIKFTKRNIH